MLTGWEKEELIGRRKYIYEVRHFSLIRILTLVLLPPVPYHYRHPRLCCLIRPYSPDSRLMGLFVETPALREPVRGRILGELCEPRV